MKRSSPLIAGRYQIEGSIATGGMAEIFLATELGPKGPLRKVAIKKILPQFSNQPKFREMFLSESEIAAKCEHPNLIRIYAVLEEGGELYLVEEYIEGVDIAQFVDKLKELGEKLPEELAALIALQVARGLDYIHNLKDEAKKPLNIVHRDINPANIMLSISGDVKILDFGIAKHLGRDLTNTNELKGKIGYLAPEQIAQKNLGPHTDLYCLGLVLYELLTLKPAIKGETDSEILAFAKEPNIASAKDFRDDISVELSEILDKLLKVDIGERYKSASELERDLLNYFSRRALPSNKELGKFVESLKIERKVRPWRETAVLSGEKVAKLKIPPHAPQKYKRIVVSEKLKKARPYFVGIALISLILTAVVVSYVSKIKGARVDSNVSLPAEASIRLAGVGELVFYVVDNSVVPVLPFGESALNYNDVRNRQLKFLSPRYECWKYVVRTRRKTPVKAELSPLLVQTQFEDNYQAFEVDGKKSSIPQYLHYGWHLVWSIDSAGKFSQVLKPYAP